MWDYFGSAYICEIFWSLPIFLELFWSLPYVCGIILVTALCLRDYFGHGSMFVGLFWSWLYVCGIILVTALNLWDYFSHGSMFVGLFWSRLYVCGIILVSAYIFCDYFGLCLSRFFSPWGWRRRGRHGKFKRSIMVSENQSSEEGGRPAGNLVDPSTPPSPLPPHLLVFYNYSPQARFIPNRTAGTISWTGRYRIEQGP